MAKLNTMEKKSTKLSIVTPNNASKPTVKKLNDISFNATKSKPPSPAHQSKQRTATIQYKYSTHQEMPYKSSKKDNASKSTCNEKSVACHTIKDSTVDFSKTTLRSKNEEAVHDLLERIPEISNIFDVHNRIGNGTFSTVLLGTLKKEKHLPDNLRRKFAIKHHVPTSHPDRIMKELQCMANMGGINNVVGINCCIRYNESVAFIMPYLQHDRFHDFYTKMTLDEVKMYMKNLLLALRHVHKFNIIHRDVKPSNFLYNRRKRQFLLVDFGLAQQVQTQQQLIGEDSSMVVGNVKHPALPNITKSEGKRPREVDEADAKCDTNDAVPKRLRVGPQGDHPTSSITSSNNSAKLSNVESSAQFKMPLKQLNEISNQAKTTNISTTSIVYDTPLGGQAKNAMSNTLPNNLTSSHVNTNIGNACVPAAIAPIPVTDASTVNKYNTNRNLIASNASKCACYGHPKVCNICLIKKEIHASRAGTPGYRPPEVLLKYPDQTTAVDIWAAGVILLSVMSSVYPFFKAPNDFVALAEMVTIFGDKTIRKTAFALDRLVTLSQRTKPLDLRKLCVRFRNRTKYSSTELLQKYQRYDGTCEVCKNCDQFFFNCLCLDSNYNTEPLDTDDDMFPPYAYDLLKKLLEVNPHKRITAEEALKHPFFDSLGNTSTSEKPTEDTTQLIKNRKQ